MATIKKGNLLKHAKASGKTITFKKPTKKTAAKKTAKKTLKKRAPVKKAPVKKTAPQSRYAIEMRKTETGTWTKLGIGGSNLERVKNIAHTYANNYPRYAFRVVS